MSLEVKIELSPDMLLVLDSLCAFYGKERWEIIEMALEHMAAEIKLITRTIDAMAPEEGTD